MFLHESAESAYGRNGVGQIAEWAQDVGALIVGIEHRYFGLSWPYGLNYTVKSTWNPKLLKPLTLQNVISDGVSLVTWIKNVKNLAAKDAKVIMFGG